MSFNSTESEYTIGVDVGTQSVRAALWSVDGKLHAQATRSLSLQRQGERIEQDPNLILRYVLSALREASNGVSAHRIRAIGIDAQMAGIVGIDDDFCPVGNYDSWLDGRCSVSFDELREEELELIGKSGGQITVAHAAKIVYQSRFEPKRYESTKRYIPLNAYLAGKLCALSAEESFCDDTHLHFNLFSDNPNRCWNEKMIWRFSLDIRKFPRICEPSEVVGRLSKKMAQETGLSEKTIVVAGMGDTAASAYGTGILHTGMVYDVAGTASVFAASTHDFCPDVKEKTLLFSRSAARGLFLPLAYVGGGGMCINWFRGLLGCEYSQLEKLASDAPVGSGGLLFNPHFEGRVCPANANCKGGYFGLRWEHTTAELYRSILESIAYEYRNYYQILVKNLNFRGEAIYGTGGGAVGDSFCQIKADVLGIPYLRMKNIDSATLACAAIAAEAGGMCEAKSMVESSLVKDKLFKPDPNHHRLYEELVEKYINYLNQAGEIV